jgi:dihydropyrimidinase
MAQSEADGPVSHSQAKGEQGRRITITNSMLHHRIDYTPFEGIQVRNWPRWVYLRGRLAWDRDGEGVLVKRGAGEFLRRTKSTLITGQMGRQPTGMMKSELSYWA